MVLSYTLSTHLTIFSFLQAARLKIGVASLGATINGKFYTLFVYRMVAMHLPFTGVFVPYSQLFLYLLDSLLAAILIFCIHVWQNSNRSSNAQFK